MVRKIHYAKFITNFSKYLFSFHKSGNFYFLAKKFQEVISTGTKIKSPKFYRADSLQKNVTFTREPCGIDGEPSALFGKKISQTPNSFCSHTINEFPRVRKHKWWKTRKEIYMLQEYSRLPLMSGKHRSPIDFKPWFLAFLLF